MPGPLNPPPVTNCALAVGPSDEEEDEGRKFDKDFREGAVRLVRETGKPIAQAARDLGINGDPEELGQC